jgi:ATP-dependent DNA helicase RecG
VEYRAEDRNIPAAAAAAPRPSARPLALSPFFADLTSIEGVGPRFAALLGKLFEVPNGGAARVIDLLLHMPSGLIDRRASPSVAEAVTGQLATLLVRVKKHHAPPRGNKRAPYRVICEDETGDIELIFFHAERPYLEKLLPLGEMRILSGRVERYGVKLQMPHPDYVVAETSATSSPVWSRSIRFPRG